MNKNLTFIDIIVYTDGSSLRCKNDSWWCGGWAFHMNICPVMTNGLLECDDGILICGSGDHKVESTNNRMELTAISEAFDWILPFYNCPHNKQKFSYAFNVHIYTDSQYSIDVLTGKYKAKLNIEYIEPILAKILRVKSYGGSVEFHHVRAHRDNVLNNLVDKYANQQAKIAQEEIGK